MTSAPLDCGSAAMMAAAGVALVKQLPGSGR
jgi:hypothetical protein